MAVATTVVFPGFRREAVQFLADLAANNDRAWFQPRKADYERLLKEPLEQLCVALEDRFRARGMPLRADPKRSPFRIYRDVRFSKDKSPYKTNIGADFPWTERGPSGQSTADTAGHGVGGYFHMSPGEIFVGGGMWHPEATRLGAWRALVDHDPGRVHAAIDDHAFVAAYGQLSGSENALKRVPSGFRSDHPEADLLRLKDVVFGRRLSDDEAFSPDLPDLVVDSLGAAVPVLDLLAGLPG